MTYLICQNRNFSERCLFFTVKPGENITLYCDCKISTGVYIVWYRNCSHEKQPSLVLKTKFEQRYYEQGIDVLNFLNPFPNFHLVKNDSSQSYDLLITNITDSDEGLYYCGTEQSKVEEKEKIDLECIYGYGNTTTRILFRKYFGVRGVCVLEPFSMLITVIKCKILCLVC
uniref:Ig-like domain-containing protein n=1 Tax=Amphilophus citrinellus TaxID=61819 RepID=A0A3Q0RZW2_AMPCI